MHGSTVGAALSTGAADGGWVPVNVGVKVDGASVGAADVGPTSGQSPHRHPNKNVKIASVPSVAQYSMHVKPSCL